MSVIVPPSLVAPDSIARDARTQGVMSLLLRLANIDMTQLSIWTLANDQASILEFLLWQFDLVTGWWQFLEGPSATNAMLIQNFMQLHQLQGTPWAVKTVVTGMGFSTPTLTEGAGNFDVVAPFLPMVQLSSPGSYRIHEYFPKPVDNNQAPSQNPWARFRMAVPIYNSSTDTNVNITGNLTTQVIGGLLYMKNTRSWLDKLSFFETPFNESLPLPKEKVAFSGGYNFLEQMFFPKELVSASNGPIKDSMALLTLVASGGYYASGSTNASESPVPRPVDGAVFFNGAYITVT